MPLIHPGLNSNAAYQIATVNTTWQRATKTPFVWLIKRRLLKNFPEGPARDTVRNQFDRHFDLNGASVTADNVSELKTFLSWINSAFNSLDDEDQKQYMREKIVEGIEHCTPGFINRLRDAILYLKQPKGLLGYLAGMRANIAEVLCRQLASNDVHDHERFIRKCNALGLGIPHIPTNDRYAVGRESHVADQAILDGFRERYSPTTIVGDLWNFTNLGQSGYSGFKKEGYKEGAYTAILKVLNTMLELSGNNRLGMLDAFTVDEDYKVQDINWVRINSLTIEYLKNKNIINREVPGLFEETFESAALPNKKVTVKYDPNNKHEATVIYTDASEDPTDPVVLTGYINEKEKRKSILSVIPKELCDRIVANLAPRIDQQRYKYVDSPLAKPTAMEAFGNFLRLNALKENDVLTWELKCAVSNTVTNTQSFGATLACLSPAQATALLTDTTTPTLRSLIKNAKDFKHLFGALNAEQKKPLLNRIQDVLNYSEWVHRAEDIYDLFHNLADEQKEVVFKQLDRDGKLTDCVQFYNPEETTKQILLVIKALPVSLIPAYLAKINYNARSSSRSLTDTQIKQLLHNTTGDKRIAIFEVYKDQFITALNAAIHNTFNYPQEAQSPRDALFSYLSYVTLAQAQELINRVDINIVINTFPALFRFSACPMPIFAMIVEKLKQNDLFASTDEFLFLLKELPQAKRAPFMTEYFNRQTIKNEGEAQNAERLVSYFRRCYNAIDRFFSSAPVVFRSNFLKKVSADATADAQWDAILQHAAKVPDSRTAKALSMMYIQASVENQAVEKKVEDFRRVYTALRQASNWSLLFASKPNADDACNSFEYGTSVDHASAKVKTVDAIVRPPVR